MKLGRLTLARPFLRPGSAGVSCQNILLGIVDSGRLVSSDPSLHGVHAGLRQQLSHHLREAGQHDTGSLNRPSLSKAVRLGGC